MDSADINNRFTFHPASSDQGATYGSIRLYAKDFATWLDSVLPDSREKSLAITHLEEVVFWSNASVARH